MSAESAPTDTVKPFLKPSERVLLTDSIPAGPSGTENNNTCADSF